MSIQNLYDKALRLEFLNSEEAIFLYEHASTPDLMAVGHESRKKQVPGTQVTWLIDRNINITNVCYSQCKFCNFYRKPGSREARSEEHTSELQSH